MTRPSEALLRWLRQQIDARGQNTATLAERLGRPRSELRRILTGAEPMMVDDLLRLTELLGITAAELGVSGGAPEVEEAPAGPDGDHWTNQTRLLFETGFRAGMDFAFTVAADHLGAWGGPEHIRKQHAGREMVIQLDSAYHRYMAPRYEQDGVSLKIGFDGLYDCHFPWSAIRRVFFTPVPPEVPAVEPVRPVAAVPADAGDDRKDAPTPGLHVVADAGAEPPSEPDGSGPGRGPRGRPSLRLVK